MEASPIWKEPSVLAWCHILLASYRHWMGTDLIEPSDNPASQSHALFHAPFVLVSHGIEDDPLLNYGNHMALSLWEFSWDELIRTPSRVTADSASGQDQSPPAGADRPVDGARAQSDATSTAARS